MLDFAGVQNYYGSGPAGIRTRNPRSSNPQLCPVELRGQKVGATGFEPARPGSQRIPNASRLPIPPHPRESDWPAHKSRPPSFDSSFSLGEGSPSRWARYSDGRFPLPRSRSTSRPSFARRLRVLLTEEDCTASAFSGIKSFTARTTSRRVNPSSGRRSTTSVTAEVSHPVLFERGCFGRGASDRLVVDAAAATVPSERSAPAILSSTSMAAIRRRCARRSKSIPSCSSRSTCWRRASRCDSLMPPISHTPDCVSRRNFDARRMEALVNERQERQARKPTPRYSAATTTVAIPSHA